MRLRKVLVIALALISIMSIGLRGSIALTQQTPVPVFFGALNEPPEGRVLSGWGQFSSAWDLDQSAGKGDADDLVAYSKTVAPHPPAMISFYVGADQAILEGFLKHYREYAASHGFFVAQIGFYFRGNERDVATGMRDPVLWTLADALRDVGRPVLIRVGYEFNNPYALYQTSGYIGAFRHVAELMRKDRATNVATVWDATAIGLSDPNYMKWYPGDDVVDWWGVNLFDPRDFGRPESAAFIADAARHHKPTLIGEASPVFETGTGQVRGAKSASEATKWYEALFDLIRAHPAVKAFSLIAVDWRRLHAIVPGKGWPDARLDKWPPAAVLVKKQLADPRFIDASEASEVFRQSRQN